jgi:hypothetical protein
MEKENITVVGPLNAWLAQNNFDVVQQGCGETDCDMLADRDEEDQPFTVLAVEDLDYLAAEADRLHDLCTQRGFTDAVIQATYIPGEPAVILLTGLSDSQFLGN